MSSIVSQLSNPASGFSFSENSIGKNLSAVENGIEVECDIQQDKERFKKPTVAEVKMYCVERSNAAHPNAGKFNVDDLLEKCGEKGK